MKFFKNYDFKRGWYRLLIFFIFDWFCFLIIFGLVYCLDHPDILPSDMLHLGIYEFSYYDMCFILTFIIIVNLLIGLFKTIYSILFDWAIHCERK